VLQMRVVRGRGCTAYRIWWLAYVVMRCARRTRTDTMPKATWDRGGGSVTAMTRARGMVAPEAFRTKRPTGGAAEMRSGDWR
jgi:hypothetical protein